jgi:general secretion pathway protein A
MYYDFYQLKENPFSVTADPDFFFSSKCHREALSHLIYGIEQRKGIILITGDVGTGKTTLCRKLLKQAHKNTKFAFILNPSFSEVELLQMINRDLGISYKEPNKLSLVYALNKFLIKESNKGNNVVLIVDESQDLGVSQLEQIRLLSNLETEKEKLLQIILVGQTELYEKLQSPELSQIRQRIAVYFHLRPLDKEDIKDYIYHRLLIAMRNPAAVQSVIFTDAAVESIYRYTHGSPRTINMLCDRALLAGFVEETNSIDENIIEKCVREMYSEHYS